MCYIPTVCAKYLRRAQIRVYRTSCDRKGGRCGTSPFDIKLFAMGAVRGVAKKCIRLVNRGIVFAVNYHEAEYEALDIGLGGILGRDPREWGRNQDEVERIRGLVTTLLDDHEKRVRRWVNLGLNMLFEWSQRASDPFMQRAVHAGDPIIIGSHIEVLGSEFLRVPRGTFVHLQREPSSVMDDDSTGEHTRMYAQGVPGEDANFEWNNVKWVRRTQLSDPQQVHVGEVENDGGQHDGLVGFVWDIDFRRAETDWDNDDEDDDSMDLYYDVVIVGSIQVMRFYDWDSLYYPMSRWVAREASGQRLPGVSEWTSNFAGRNDLGPGH